MHIQCPYCKCDYDVRSSMLGEPIGNDELGYGWWLRCYKCHKKFWLSNAKIIDFDLTPIKADKEKKSKLLETLILPKKQKAKSQSKIKWSKYIFIIFIGAGIGIIVHNQKSIRNFFARQAISFINSRSTALKLNNVSYRIYEINGQTKIYVCGYIENRTNTVMSFNAIQINVINTQQMAITLTWNAELNIKTLLPGDRAFFASESPIQYLPQYFKVNISII